MRIFLTGGTGAIGSRALVHLLEAGHEVTALARSDAAAAVLARAGARWVPGDLFDRPVLRAALTGQDAAVNLATRIPADALRPRAWREDDRLRTQGSRVLAEAAVAAGVPRLVQESVTFVYPDRGEEWITERTGPAPNGASQAATMAAAANAAWFGEQGGAGVVLRFGQVYGPDRNSRAALHRVRAGQPVLLGRPAGWISPLHADDAGRAVLAALGCPGGVYNVCEVPVPRRDWAHAMGRAALGAGATRPAMFYPLALQRLAGPRAEPLTRSHRVSSAAFTGATGWRPAYDGLRGGWAGRPAAATR